MLQLRDFLNFEHYLTPSIIRMFYLLQLVLIALFALTNFFAGIAAMTQSFILGIFWMAAAVAGGLVAALGARIVTEIIMVLFQNNEHLAAIRARAEGR